MKQQHGGNIYRYPDHLDFSANLNPLGMPPAVREAVCSETAGWEHYPDPDCTALTTAIAAAEGIAPDRIVCGNGAADLIYRLVHAFRPQKAVLCAPTFGEYAAALHEVGCRIDEYVLHEANAFSLDAGFLDCLTPDTDMVFLCSPNNPTGQLTDPALLTEIARTCDENGILLLCDECFLDFTGQTERYSLKRCLCRNAVILRAFTKTYAMPGLRLGFVLCSHPEIAQRIRESGQFWSVSAPAQAAGIAALHETAYLQHAVALLAQERHFLTDALRALGIRVFPSAANFLLLHGTPGLDDRLLQEGILIRNCADYHGLCEGYYRTAVRTHAENLRLCAAFGRCI